MRGVIAAGAPTTAEAGARILERGGNAVDAAVAACFATAVGEPTLTSLAGGGMILYRDGHSGEAVVCDCFADVPRTPAADVAGLDFRAVDLDFGPTTQRFYIGRGSAAVPGVIPGLCTALERWGSLPLGEVVRPACEMLREGRPLGPYQGRAAKLLDPILTHSAAGRRIFAPHGRIIAAGDRFRLPELADTLEAMARQGWQEHYRQAMVPAMLAQFGPAHGGLLTPADLDGYQIVFREPLELSYRQIQVLTVPPPHIGGSMICLMLGLLAQERLGSLPLQGTAHALRLCCAMQVADEARTEAARALVGRSFEGWHRRFAELVAAGSLGAAPSPGGPGSTTHVSAIDAAGTACAVTFSYGEGNGYFIGDTGIAMNNLMGEEDLHPAGFGRAPGGTRLATMMAPTLLVEGDGSVTAMGTGGANRIRSAIVQVVSLLCDFGLGPEPAVAAPRVHFEKGELNAEMFGRDDGGASLAALGAAKLVRFDEPNLFFGGVHLVRRAPDGTLSGAGDPRRGGVCRVVE